jgi:hypothetical protein
VGEAAHRLNGGEVAVREPEPEPEPRALEREIDGIRGDLDGLVRELERRRRDALDWRLQLRLHRREIAWSAAGAAVLFYCVRAWRRRRAPSLLERVAEAIADQ